MSHHPNDPVIVLDTTYKPAGTGIILQYESRNNYYTVKFRFFDSNKEEIIDVPSQRILIYEPAIAQAR